MNPQTDRRCRVQSSRPHRSLSLVKIRLELSTGCREDRRVILLTGPTSSACLAQSGRSGAHTVSRYRNEAKIAAAAAVDCGAKLGVASHADLGCTWNGSKA